jgi:3-hydroxy acid dehydrogenase / malonic semialdehyde reductase
MVAYDTSPKPLQDLRGQVALVTGASSGIGQAIVEQLVKRGTHVALFARRTDRLQALAERLAEATSPEAGNPGETLVITGDVRDGEDVQRGVAATLERWGKLDILVANAGFGYRLSVVEGDPQRWKEMIDTNVYGLLLTLKYGVPHLLEHGAGHVVVTSSIAARVPTPGGAAYCGTKSAATTIADSLRQEVGPRGVRVTTIEPGVVISEFQQVAQYAPDILPAMLKGAVPLVPLDIARAVLFALELPAHVGVNELVVRPTRQAYP